MQWRIRYFKDEKAYDSEDKSNWYHFRIEGTLEKALAPQPEIHAAAQLMLGVEIEFINLRCRGDDIKVMQELNKTDWGQIKHLGGGR